MDRIKHMSVPALERGFAILEFLARTKNGSTLSQMARLLKLPKSSVHCLLTTLQELGYVCRGVNSTRYHLSGKIFSLTQMASGGMFLRELAKPHLERLAQATNLTVQMAAMIQMGQCIIVEKFSPPHAPPVATWVGKHVSLHCTALGKALAAFLPESEVDAIIDKQGLLRHNDNTICSPTRLKKELHLVRERGYAIDDEEEEVNFCCVGAPVFDGRNQAIAAVSAVGKSTQFGTYDIGRISPHVVAAAKAMSADFKTRFPENFGFLMFPREMSFLANRFSD
jgi:DNA-binding IclR family transcriptional regulator